MDFKTLIEEIKRETQISLAEDDAINLMFSYPRPKALEVKNKFPEARKSAVNIFLFQKNQKILFPVIKRPKYNGHHSQQISLPGGKHELNDSDLNFTSKRETFEEVGIGINLQKSITKLSDIYIPPSNFIVSPYITFHENKQCPIFMKNDYEVEQIIYIDILDIINFKNIIETSIILKDNKSIKVKAFQIQNEIIWGATGIILAEFSIILKRIFKKKNILQHK